MSNRENLLIHCVISVRYFPLLSGSMLHRYMAGRERDLGHR